MTADTPGRIIIAPHGMGTGAGLASSGEYGRIRVCRGRAAAEADLPREGMGGDAADSDAEALDAVQVVRGAGAVAPTRPSRGGGALVGRTWWNPGEHDERLTDLFPEGGHDTRQTCVRESPNGDRSRSRLRSGGSCGSVPARRSSGS